MFVDADLVLSDAQAITSTDATASTNVIDLNVTGRKIRSDAKLYDLPEPSTSGPGRKPVYGKRAPTPEELRQDNSVPWQRVRAFAAGKMHDFKIKMLRSLRWRPAGQAHNLGLIVIAPLGYRLKKHSRILYRQPAFLICTEPDADIQQIIQPYVWRWDIEVNFRDEKTILGVGQAQIRKPTSVENVPALAVAAYAMLLTAAANAYGPAGQPDTVPAPKWRNKDAVRASTQTLRQHLRHEVWAQSLNFSGFTSSPAPNSKPEKLQNCLPNALFYAMA